MQRSNLILFIVLSALIIATYFWFANTTNTAKNADKDGKKTVQLAKDKTKSEQKSVSDKKQDEKKDDTEKKKPEVTPPVKREPALTRTLGGDGYHLTADLTTLGAGVRKVVLNRFKAADWQGRPTEDNLELIQDDEFSPSFRMYHYLESKAENPVLGLGEQIWKVRKSDKEETTEKDGKTFTKHESGKTTVKDSDGALLWEEFSFSTRVPDLDFIEITKTYRLGPKDYHLTLLIEVRDKRDRDGDNKKTIPFRYQLTGGQGLPIEGEWYASTFRNALMGMVDPSKNLWRKIEESSRISGRKGGDTWPDDQYSRGNHKLQYAGVVNQFFGVVIVVDDKQPGRDDGGKDADKILAWARPTLETTEKRGVILKIRDDSIEFTDGKKIQSYTLLPRTKKHFEDLELHEGQKVALSYYETPDGKRIATWVRLGDTPRPQFDDITVRVNSEAFDLDPGVKVAHQFILYHGPVKTALLAQFTGDKAVPSKLVEYYIDELHLRTLTDYHSDNWFGRASSWIGLTWLIIKFTTLMHTLLNWLHYIFGYGLSIVVLTIIVRGMMFPISRKQALFSIKMQELAPELKKIQEKYTDDPSAKMQATQEFYRKHGINPLGSCWPVFLQMPIFLGLYFAFQESIHFRLANFLWISSLAAPDMLIPWTENIPFISTPDSMGSMLYLGPYFNILPMIAVVFMMIQQMQTMPPPTDDQQAMQQKMLKFMSIFFGIMFYKVAAGLCIYFISSSLWGMAERKLLPKKKSGTELSTPTGTSAASAAAKAAPPKGKDKWSKNKDKEKPKEPVTAMDKLKALWRDILKSAEKK